MPGWNKWKRKEKVREIEPQKQDDKACWKAFSEYIRTRDCIRVFGDLVASKCVTCGKPISYSGNDAGHFISCAINPTKYDTMNVHIQCTSCNRFAQGKHFEYRNFLVNFYGKERVEDLEYRARQIDKRYHDWAEEAKGWREMKKILIDLFERGEIGNSISVRKFISDHMKAGTLEDFLQDNIKRYKKI